MWGSEFFIETLINLLLLFEEREQLHLFLNQGQSFGPIWT